MYLPPTNKNCYAHPLYRRVIVFVVFTTMAVSSTIITLTEEEKTKALSYQDRFCGENRMCSKSNNTDDTACRLCPGCKCDDFCDKYGDCCADRTLELMSTPNFHPSRYRCHSNAFKLIYDKKDEFSFHSIQKCSIRHDEDLVQLCENPDLNNITLAVPAQTRQELYKNQFCAQCNGDTNFTLWAIKAECTHLVWLEPGMTSLQMIMSFVNNPGCAIFLHPPSAKSYRECYIPEDEIVSSCNVSKQSKNYDESMEKLCLAYSSPIHLFNKVYRNTFCYICNHGTLDDSFIPAPSCAFDTPYPFSVVLDPEAIQTYHEPTVLSCECDPGSIYDNHTDECLRMECTADRILRDESCFSVIRSANGLVYLLEVKLRPQEHLYINDSIDVWVPSTAKQLKTYFTSQLGDGGIAIGLFRVQVHVSDTEVDSITVHTQMKIVWEKEIDDLESNLIGIRESTWNVTLDGSQTLFKAEPYWTNPEDTTMYPSVITEILGDNSTTLTLDYGFTINLTQNHSALFVAKTLKCPRVPLKFGVNYETRNDSDSFFHVGSNTTIDISLFEPSSSSSGFVCYSVFKQNDSNCGKTELMAPVVAKSPYLMYVSLAFQALAMFCIFLTFVIYCTFKKLRTLAGHNTMGVLFTMLAAVTLYTFGRTRVEFPLPCMVIGLSAHFFLLSSITWMFICTLHMYLTVKNVLMGRQPEARSPKKRYALYFLTSLLVPGIVLGATVGANYGLTNGQQLGYGVKLCYVSNFYSVLLAVEVPLAIVIILTSSIYAATAVVFRGRNKEHRDLKKSRDVISTYVKLSVFTAITWTFALVSIFIDHDAFKYVFVILSGLLGMFIFISFICTRAVWDILTECRKGKSLYKSGTAYASDIKMTYTGKDSEIYDIEDIENDYASIACVKNGDFDHNDLNGKLEIKSEIDDSRSKGNMNRKNVLKDMLSKHISDSDSVHTVSTTEIDNDEANAEAKAGGEQCDDHYGLLADAVTKEVADPYTVMFNPGFQ